MAREVIWRGNMHGAEVSGCHTSRIGVSMHVTRKRAVGIARHFDVGRGVAEVDLRGSTVAWARTGGRGHVTVWAPPELLLRAVVQCDEHE